MSYQVTFRPECPGCKKVGLIDIRDGVVTFYMHWILDELEERKVYIVKCRECGVKEKMQIRLSVYSELTREEVPQWLK